MGRVAELNRAIDSINEMKESGTILSVETAYLVSVPILLESIAKSLAWYMDRTEKRDRYDDAVPYNISDALNDKLITYAYSNYGGNQEAFDAVINLPISDWIEEIREGTENGE